MASGRFLSFDREEWAKLRESTPLTVEQADLEALRGIGVHISLDEVETIYLPLTRLLNLYVSATQNLHRATSTFLAKQVPPVPYVIGVAGSVAVGKSTLARLLQALLSRWPDHPTVELVTTDGFLFPNAVLERRGIMDRKGFPESYDTRRLLNFLNDVKSGMSEVKAPVYSHILYDIVPDEELVVRQPDILILEGLNVLQVAESAGDFVSDYFDFSIFVDADERDIEQWFKNRFFALRETVFTDPNSFFRGLADLSYEEAAAFAHQVWININGKNLRENILPSRDRASLIFRKGADHCITGVMLRRL